MLGKAFMHTDKTIGTMIVETTRQMVVVPRIRSKYFKKYPFLPSRCSRHEEWCNEPTPLGKKIQAILFIYYICKIDRDILFFLYL